MGGGVVVWLCVAVQGFAQSLLKRMSQRSTVPGCGVTFEIVSNIPGVSTGPRTCS